MTNPHPKATIAGSGSAAGVAIVAILGAFGVTLDPAVAALIAGAIGPILLLIGQQGLAGIWNTVIHGRKDE